MTDQKSIDKLISDAQSFQGLVEKARIENPALADVLLGSFAEQNKNAFGSLAIGGIVLLSAHYGFGWTEPTIYLVAGSIGFIANSVLNLLRVRKYRKTLLQNLPETPLSVQSSATPAPSAMAPNSEKP